MDWDKISACERIPGRVASKAIQYELNEIYNNNPRENSPESCSMKTAISKLVAESMGYCTLTQMQNRDLDEAHEKADMLIGMVRQGLERRV